MINADSFALTHHDTVYEQINVDALVGRVGGGGGGGGDAAGGNGMVTSHAGYAGIAPI